MDVTQSTATPSLSQNTTSSSSPTQESASFQAALDAFYELHQQSQITGVSTAKYNAALESLGLEAGDNLEAIHLLSANGYNTGAPSVDAILKYGDTTQEVGNHSYMKQEQMPLSRSTPQELEDEATTTDVKEIAEEFLQQRMTPASVQQTDLATLLQDTQEG